MAESESIFVGDLPGNVDEAQLQAIFGAYGTITSSKLLAPGARGTRAAIISYGTIAEAKWLVENLNGNIPEGIDTPVLVRFKDQNKGGKGVQPDMSWNAGKGGTMSWADGKGTGRNDSGSAVFIGNLPGDMNEQTLHQVFGAYGTIRQATLMPPNSNGKKAAIVEFSTQQEASWIVENLNGNLPEGLIGTDSVVVKFKQAGSKGDAGATAWGKGWGKGDVGDGGWGPYDKGKGDKGGKGNKGGKCGIKTLVDGLMDSGAMPGGVKYSNDEAALFVGGLPPDTNDVDLFWIFSPFGAIAPRGVKAMMTPDNSQCKGIGFVNYLDPNNATQAIATLNGTQMPDGNTLVVSQKRTNSSSGGKSDAKGNSKGDGSGDWSQGSWSKGNWGKGKW
eukprot:TRINITY_DN1680_c4_g1_i1.p1 TRINITY_DN1680_c4_g1~~TRINITY_DN1680_c4_g1_i1.p1  ORF type:complete len:389 (-),score=54.04 TRINITY_DN1680_c4_g1_i1:140-1306(-)